ncbi:hypothetical protein [Streptomyces sp. NPDC096934]|uniref:hypothetical protein n=1 Tax=Streptomyces sp. NPDC096934 TaxID=3155551 RepID=UPI00331E68C8
MTRSQFLPVYDAVHGTIDLHDPNLFGCAEILQLLLESPNVQRLHRLQQLPFGERAFLGSTHTRFSHAMGTAHVALRLLQRLQQTGFFSPDRVAELRTSLPSLSAHSDDGTFVRLLSEHVILAGLLQDIGELPHKPSTGLFFSAHSTLSLRLTTDLEMSTEGMSDKEIFTINGILDLFQAHKPLRDYLEIGLLVYLISGKESGDTHIGDTLRAIRQIVDGVVDADRLDYVHRDSHHSIGGRISTSARDVIESLITYDKDGPIFNSAGPVANFMLLRTILRSQVYSAPAVRFQGTLLAVTLSELLRRHSDWMAKYFDAKFGALTGDAFLKLDDRSLFASLSRLRTDQGAEVLDRNVARAADAMLRHDTQYEYLWLYRPETPEPEPAKVELKPDVFVDTYWDYETHRLYRPGSIRVSDALFSASGQVVPLESTVGHVSEFLKMMWDAPPVQDNVLFFVPPSRVNWFHSTVEHDEASRYGLYRAAIARDAETRLSVVDNTRDEPSHTGPLIFVTFCWEDIDSMRAILRLLYERRRRYIAYVEDFHGLAGNTRKNGSEYASQADAAIVLLSRKYVEHAINPNGNIYPELIALGRKLPAERIIPVTLDAKADYRGKLKEFPWALIGYEEAPYLGAPIRNGTTNQLVRALEAVLKIIDSTSTT